MLSGLLPASFSDLAPARGPGLLSPWPTLLVADSDEEMIRTLVCFFEKRGFHVASAATLAQVQDYFYRRKTWTLIIADYHLPDGSGAELCQWVRDQGSDTPVLLMSGSPYAATLCAGNEYLQKPFPIEKLEAYVQNVHLRGHDARAPAPASDSPPTHRTWTSIQH
jgi:two-component system, NtrC family, response regulator HydG